MSSTASNTVKNLWIAQIVIVACAFIAGCGPEFFLFAGGIGGAIVAMLALKKSADELGPSEELAKKYTIILVLSAVGFALGFIPVVGGIIKGAMMLVIALMTMQIINAIVPNLNSRLEAKGFTGVAAFGKYVPKITLGVSIAIAVLSGLGAIPFLKVCRSIGEWLYMTLCGMFLVYLILVWVKVKPED